MGEKKSMVILLIAVIAMAGVVAYRLMSAEEEPSDGADTPVNDTATETVAVNSQPQGADNRKSKNSEVSEEAIKQLTELEEDKDFEGADDEELLAQAVKLAHSNRAAQQSKALEVFSRLGGVEAAKESVILAKSTNRDIAVQALDVVVQLVASFEDDEKREIVPGMKELIMYCEDSAEYDSLLQQISTIESRDYVLNTYADLLKQAKDANKDSLRELIEEYVSQSCDGDETVKTPEDIAAWLKKHPKED